MCDRIPEPSLGCCFTEMWGKNGQVNADTRLRIENVPMAFRLLAKSYAGLTATQVGQLLAGGDFVEICHGDETRIQK